MEFFFTAVPLAHFLAVHSRGFLLEDNKFHLIIRMSPHPPPPKNPAGIPFKDLLPSAITAITFFESGPLANNY